MATTATNQQEDNDKEQPQPNQLNQQELVGISIQGWDVATSQGPIGDQHWFESVTESLEGLSQFHHDNGGEDGSGRDGGGGGGSGGEDNDPKEQQQQPKRRRRKIVLPEMVYPKAHVFLEHTTTTTTNASLASTTAASTATSATNDDDNNVDIMITWDALHALEEWSVAHTRIPLPTTPSTSTSTSSTSSSTRRKDDTHNTVDNVDNDDMGNDEDIETAEAATGEEQISSLVTSFRGVSVLESSDAKLWKQKGRHHRSSSVSAPTTTTTTTSSSSSSPMFHYDWTYSTPFVGNCVQVRVQGGIGSTTTTTTNTSTMPTITPTTSTPSSSWIRLEQSGMNRSLLTDQSVPILYYDQIDLYEDDLHDNGYVHYHIKVRVMPQCIYVLARLFVRVDHVVLRTRDARWLVDFEQQHTIFRDITWRQVHWDELAKLSLPHQVRDWTSPTEVQQQSQSQQQASSSSPGEHQQRFEALLNQIPLVPAKDIPSDLPRHSKLMF